MVLLPCCVHPALCTAVRAVAHLLMSGDAQHMHAYQALGNVLQMQHCQLYIHSAALLSAS